MIALKTIHKVETPTSLCKKARHVHGWSYVPYVHEGKVCTLHLVRVQCGFKMSWLLVSLSSMDGKGSYWQTFSDIQLL